MNWDREAKRRKEREKKAIDPLFYIRLLVRSKLCPGKLQEPTNCKENKLRIKGWMGVFREFQKPNKQTQKINKGKVTEFSNDSKWSELPFPVDELDSGKKNLQPDKACDSVVEIDVHSLKMSWLIFYGFTSIIG